MKTTIFKNKIILLITLITISLSSIVAQVPKKPTPPRLVNDFADILSPNDEAYLERKLVNFNDTTSNQITIVTVPHLNGMSISQFAYEIGEKWKIGQKEFDNGIVIVVKPKTRNSKGEAYIASGYGLESVIPDATANRIIDVEMIPLFKQNKYAQGLDNASTVLMGLAAGEFSSDKYNNNHPSNSNGGLLIPLIAIFIAIIMMKKTTKGKTYGRSTSNNTGWLLSALLFSSMGNRHSGYYDNFSSGSGSFGGGFGGNSGGFGGFGGGSFGGGGAGGSW